MFWLICFCLAGIAGTEKLKKFENDWILGKKSCNNDHYDCLYSCQPKNKDLNGSYVVRIVIKDANVAPQIRAQMRLINQLYLDFINTDQQFKIYSVGKSLSLFDVREDENYFYFIEKIDGDDYHSLAKGRGLDEEWSRGLVISLLQTVSMMHLFGIVHLGLNAKNVIVSKFTKEPRSIKIKNCGLGCVISKMVSESNYHDCRKNETACGYIDSIFVAPEVLNRENNNSNDNCNMNPSSDIWSLGLLIFQIVYGRSRIPVDDIMWWAKNKTRRRFPRHNRNKKVSEKWAHLICQMIQKDPNDRITAMEALNHPVLKHHTKDWTGCLCRGLQPTLFILNTLNTLNTLPKTSKTTSTTLKTSKTSTNGNQANYSYPVSVFCDLCKIYSSNADHKKIKQADETFCNLILAKLLSNESNATEADALIMSIIMDMFLHDIDQVKSILLKSIYKEKLNGIDVGCTRSINTLSIATFVFAIINNCLDCNGKNFQELKPSSQWKILNNLYFAILENEELIKMVYKNAMAREIEDEYTIYERKQEIDESQKFENKYGLSIELDDNLNIKNFNHLIRDTPKLFACGAFFKFLCPYQTKHWRHTICDTLIALATDEELPDCRHYATLVMENIFIVTFGDEPCFHKMISIVKKKKPLLNVSRLLKAAVFKCRNTAIVERTQADIDRWRKKKAFREQWQIFEQLISIFAQQGDHKQVLIRDETLNFLLQASVSIGCHTSVQTICRLYPNIEINQTLLKNALFNNRKHVNQVFDTLIVTLSKQQHLDKELNSIYYNLLCEAVSRGSFESTQLICTIFPNVQIDKALLRKAINVSDKTFAVLVAAFSKQQHLDKELNSIYYNLLCKAVSRGSFKPTQLICTIFPNVQIDIALLKKTINVSDETFNALVAAFSKLQLMDKESNSIFHNSLCVAALIALFGSTEVICNIFPHVKVDPNLLEDAIEVKIEIFNCLLTTLLKQDATNVIHFTFLYDLFTFAVVEKREESKRILSPWLQQARKHMLNKHDNNHKIKNMVAGQVDEWICIMCLKTGKHVEYCTKCNFVLCQGCANQVMLFGCLYLFLLDI